jgi:hypothetical protein
MPRELVRRAVPVQRGEQLPAAYWPQLESVRVPGSPDRIDLVLVGPSGVQVVIDRPERRRAVVAPTSDATADLQDAARRAEAAAAAIAEILPARYRLTVTAAVRLLGDTEVAVTVGGVEAASPDVLRHMWRQRPRVLSTSEAGVVSGLLRQRLEPCPAASPGRQSRWRGWRTRCLIGASVVTGAAAVALGATSPWGMP